MRQTLFLLTLFLAINCKEGATGERTTPKSWTEADRSFLLQGLKDSRDQLISEMENLREEQWQFHEAEGRWSMGEIVEHIQVHDELYYREITVISQLPEMNEHLHLAQGRDEDVLSYETLTDQNRGQSPWYLAPRGRWCSKTDALEAFLLGRNKIIDFVENTDKDLRKYVTPSGRGEADMRDLHQLMLISIAHTNRHLSQFRQVKQHSDFPENK